MSCKSKVTISTVYNYFTRRKVMTNSLSLVFTAAIDFAKSRSAGLTTDTDVTVKWLFLACFWTKMVD